MLASILQASNRMVPAREAADQAVTLGGEDALGWHVRSEIYREMEQLEEALRSAKRATELDPFHAGYWKGLARVQLEMGDRRNAVDALRQALSIDPIDREAIEQIMTLEASDSDG
jgi:predicted Zn-dependent protease